MTAPAAFRVDHQVTWESIRLGEFVTLKRGYDLPSSLRVDGPVPVVSSSGVTGRHDTAKVEGPGVVTGRYGTLGEVFFITEDFWPLNTSLYVQDFKGNDPRFSAYFLESILGNTNSDKAAVPGVNRNDLHALPVRVTRDIGEQRAVTSILSAYDDLVENNRQRIRLLEQAARLLYEEWFVRRRFPGHEHDTAETDIPAGWTTRRLSDVCDTIGGGTPSTKVPEYWNGDVTWVVPSDVTNNDCLVLLDSERKITEKGLRESSARMVPADTILMTSRASVGFFALMDREVATNQGFINIIPRDERLRMYLLFNLMSRVAEIRANAKGTTYPEISKGRFRAMNIVIPGGALAEKFSDIALNIVRQVRCLKRSISQLKNARDALLPRVMTGEIAV